ncbi:hypothetical protein CL646_03640 [bacterium]|nr:hypothetical protein [bacterium]
MPEVDNALHKIMSFIDDHSGEISEGDYLDMCNKLRDVYRVEDRPPVRVRTLPRSLQTNPLDSIYEKCMILVRKRKEIKSNILKHKIRQRITQRFKKEAINAFCDALNLPPYNSLDELRNDGYIIDTHSFFTDYKNIMNDHIRGLQTGYAVELDNIELEMERICNFIEATDRVIDAFYEIEVTIQT